MKFKYTPLPDHGSPEFKPGDVVSIPQGEAEFFIRSVHWQEVEAAAKPKKAAAKPKKEIDQ